MVDSTGAKPFEAAIRIEISPALPLDPLRIQTMADYDLTLCLYRTWFEYDDSRKAKPGIISQWSFDADRGLYQFKISDTANWSDSSPITSSQLIQNLKRAVELKTSYGSAIASVVDLNKAKALTSKAFEIPTRDGKPSELFFQRMGSSFLAPINPQDLTDGQNVRSNTLSNGPYKIVSIDTRSVRLARNDQDRIAPVSRPSSIEIRRDSLTSLRDFIEGKSWSNVLQTATLMPFDLAEKIQQRHLPYWSRGFDRVSSIKPIGTGEALKARRQFLISFGKAWSAHKVESLPFNIAKAFSLQPKGYPLFKEISFQLSKEKIKPFPGKIKILTGVSPQFEVQQSLISKVVAAMGAQVEWIPVRSYAEAANAIKTDPNIGFQILNFGVADPEPTTWMGLVVGSESFFVDVEHADIQEYTRIAHFNSKEKEISGFQSLLMKMALRGSYVPLFHFSTLSIAQPGVSFDRIHELDETVDYSKLIKVDSDTTAPVEGVSS